MNNTDIPTYLYLNFSCNNRCLFCASKETNNLYLNAQISIEDLFKKINKNYFLNRNSSTVIISGGEPTVHPQLIEIIYFLKKWFKQIYLMTNGVKLADPNYLRLVLESGVTSFSTPLYGDEHLHNYLTGSNSYRLVMTFIERIYNLKERGECINLDLKLLFNKANYKYNPILAQNLLDRFGGEFSYSINGLFRSDNVVKNDMYSPFDQIGKYISETILILQKFLIPIRLSLTPLCYIERDILNDIIFDLFEQKKFNNDFVYYFRPDTSEIKLFRNDIQEYQQCKECDIYELCEKFSSVNSEKYGNESVFPIKF